MKASGSLEQPMRPPLPGFITMSRSLALSRKEAYLVERCDSYWQHLELFCIVDTVHVSATEHPLAWSNPLHQLVFSEMDVFESRVKALVAPFPVSIYPSLHQPATP